jgi:hypothetical protein
VTGTALLTDQAVENEAGTFVFLAGTSSLAMTGANGAYALTGVTAGTYTLIATKANYTSASATVVVTAGVVTVATALSLSPLSAPTFTVSYDANLADGSAPVDPNLYLAGATAVAQGPGSLTKPGTTFAGWNTKSDGSGIAYASQAPLVLGSASVKVFAVWTMATTYSVVYDPNNANGSGPVDSNAYLDGTTAVVQGPGSLTKPGTTFAGWNTKSDGSGIAYASQAPLVMGPASVKLYAVWTTATTYSVSYNGTSANWAQVPVDANHYVTGATALVQGPGTMVKPGASFAGWNTKYDGTGIAYAPQAPLVLGTSSVTLFAVWATPTISVIYDANTAAGAAPVDTNKYSAGDTAIVQGPGTPDQDRSHLCRLVRPRRRHRLPLRSPGSPGGAEWFDHLVRHLELLALFFQKRVSERPRGQRRLQRVRRRVHDLRWKGRRGRIDVHQRGFDLEPLLLCPRPGLGLRSERFCQRHHDLRGHHRRVVDLHGQRADLVEHRY